jgi:shikimate dehydrogenase
MRFMSTFNGKPTMIDMITKDTTLCLSLSARPSNNGTRLHNYLYANMGLNYIYKAFAPADIEQAIMGVRGLGIRGAAVSMPYKEDVIPLVDSMDRSASAIQSVNTIVNDEGRLTAYNTDYTAVEQLVAGLALDPETSFLVQGAGGMAKAVVAAVTGLGFSRVTVQARRETAGRALAEQYGATWSADSVPADVIVNVTPLGMEGPDADALSFASEIIDTASVVFDVVALPAETPLITAARAAGKRVVTGADVAVLQSVEQFVLYTGVRPDPELVAEAGAYLRS